MGGFLWDDGGKLRVGKDQDSDQLVLIIPLDFPVETERPSPARAAFRDPPRTGLRMTVMVFHLFVYHPVCFMEKAEGCLPLAGLLFCPGD